MDPKLLCQVLNKSVQVSSSSLSTLEGNCLTVGMKFHGETPHNGNCFFEAASSQLQKLNCTVQISPQQLRQDVVAFLTTNRVLDVSEGTIDLAEFIFSENFDDYCLQMVKDGELADHVVVIGMPRMLEKDIMIVTSSPFSGPDSIIAWVVGQEDFHGEPILLGHVWENHYESLQPIEPVIPEEILRMDEESIRIFKEALRDRTVKVCIIRVMVVGQDGVGKTTSSKQLLGHDLNISERKSTEGIDAHVHCCRVSLATGEWVRQDKVFSLPPNMRDNKLSERQLGRLSMKIGCKSVHLGLELGLSWADIEQIQKDYPNTVTKCFTILFKWKLQSGDKATFRNLEKAFGSADTDVVILKSVNTAGDRVSCLPPNMLGKEPEGGHLKQICSRIWTGHVHLSVELESPIVQNRTDSY